jgi:CTP synthase (UTP-ammonia lyase)
MASFYGQVYAVLATYFGDSTEKFLHRQIKYHLSKSPESITPLDKEKLAKWCRISSALILSKKDAEEMYQKILSL